MPLTVADLPTLITLLEEAPVVRARLRATLDLNALDRVPDRLDRIETAIQELVEAQKRSEARLAQAEGRLDRIEEIQERTAEGLQRLEATVQKLADSQVELRQMSNDMAEWRKGEEGRRAGEAYERQILRRAANLFNFGEGGSPAASDVARHLRGLLQSHPLAGVLSPEQDPFLADVIWWKGNHYAVTEVSVPVDNNDIKRAARRAEVLRASGVNAIPVVIGEDWASLLNRQEAEKLAVEWKVGNELSAGLIEYRKLAS